jgi:hypothetical protein
MEKETLIIKGWTPKRIGDLKYGRARKRFDGLRDYCRTQRNERKGDFKKI